jgi:lipopolysaccharide/colanic/teichoic acid biosynthesis glycosyltransferase
MSTVAQPKTSSRTTAANGSVSTGSPLAFLDQGLFTTMLRLERKRTERSQRRFVLMLLDASILLKAGGGQELFSKVATVLAHSIRETDIMGWYKDQSVIGVIFTEVGAAEGKSITAALLAKVTNALGTTLTIEQINAVRVSFHIFPEHANEQGPGGPTDSMLYPDLNGMGDAKRAARMMKRSIDIAGSLFALLTFSPFFILIAVIIKLTSKGPVLFRQERIGQYGRKFTFLKFRSMYFANDHAIHKEYVKRLIAGTATAQQNGRKPEAYKLTNDPRITPFGRILRKTSVDEIPQFLNVLAGSMSLVGPRPPVPYEFEAYEMWHRQRLVAVKPGITGQWQVGGRSRTTFDEMVRMDLKYCSSWTVLGDLKILSQTPRAVLSGVGAY